MTVYEIRKGKAARSPRQEVRAFSDQIGFPLPVGQGTTADALNLRIAMPGISDDSFSFSVNAKSVALYGVRREPEVFGDAPSVRYAIPYGAFYQTIPLPEGLDIELLEANFHHGILDIHIPFFLKSAQ